MADRWVVWSVEYDILEADGNVSSARCEEFDVGSYAEFADAYACAVFELEENAASVCVYIVGENGNIWFALDGLTREGVYCGPGVKNWGDALATMSA
jgi:hypothetical protein